MVGWLLTLNAVLEGVLRQEKIPSVKKKSAESISHDCLTEGYADKINGLSK